MTEHEYEHDRACREWAARSGVPDDDWKSRAGFVAGYATAEARALRAEEALEEIERLAAMCGGAGPNGIGGMFATIYCAARAARTTGGGLSDEQ